MEVFKKITGLLVLFWGLCLHGQECPDPVSPLPGETGVSVTSTISWEEVVGVTGYQISLGYDPRRHRYSGQNCYRGTGFVDPGMQPAGRHRDLCQDFPFFPEPTPY